MNGIFRTLAPGSLVGLLFACSGADPHGAASPPIETVELVATPAPGPTADTPKAPLERGASGPAEVGEVGGEDGALDAALLPPPPLPSLVGPQTPVAHSTVSTASTTELARLVVAIDAVVGRDAPNMIADGGTLAGRFAAGDVLERVLLLQPGHCYTVVAVGQGAVAEIDVAIVAAMMPTMPTMLLATDTDSGPSATLGRTPSCFKHPLPMALPVLVRATVTRGSGPGAFRVMTK